MLVCLLPARNCADDLPGYLDSAARFADAIVALDDGSTDGTRELLECSPLVRIVLENSSRTDYRGWDDSANRNRLLAAAAELEPNWIMSLDADERIDATDAAALREFVATEAVPGDAYLFRVFRMIGDLAHYDQSHLWVGRLFAFERGQLFPAERLHFVPLPTNIPRSRWRETTFRVQHLGGLTESRRRAAFEKYRQADPDRVFQREYSHILQRPGKLRSWWPRPPHVPLCPNTRNARAQWTRDVPMMSVVLVSQESSCIERMVASVGNQVCVEPFEVIVVTADSGSTAAALGDRHPQVRIVGLERSVSVSAARNAGLVAARGDFVLFPEPDVEMLPGSLAAWISGHRLGYAMVSGTPLNATRTASAWAGYFLDNGACLPDSPSGELRVPPVHCSYLRAALLEVGGFPEDMCATDETTVSAELFERGYGAYRTRDARYVHHSPYPSAAALFRERYKRGRAAANQLLDKVRAPRRFALRRIVGHIALRIPRRLRRVSREVWASGGPIRWRYAVAFPFVVGALVSEWLGAATEIARHGPAAYRRLS